MGQEYNFQLNISDEEMFASCIRTLISSTFIIGEKDDKKYSYVSSKGNFYNISNYLRVIGCDVEIDEDLKIVRLIADANSDGSMRKLGLYRFTADEYHMLLVIWLLYLEHRNRGEKQVVVTQGEIISAFDSYGVKFDPSSLSSSLKVFKNHNLIDYSTKDFNKSQEAENAQIHLFASLQFGWNESQFRTVVKERCENFSDNNAALLENEEGKE